LRGALAIASARRRNAAVRSRRTLAATRSPIRTALRVEAAAADARERVDFGRRVTGMSILL
jgi:hypothetical protein